MFAGTVFQIAHTNYHSFFETFVTQGFWTLFLNILYVLLCWKLPRDGEILSVKKQSLVAKMIKKKRILNEYAFFMTVYLFQVQALWLEAASWPKTLKGAVMKPYLMVQRSQVSRVKSILIFLFRLSWLLQSYAHLHIAIASKDIT